MAQNPNIDDDTRARALKFAADNAADSTDTAEEEVAPKAMPRRPVSRTPVAEPSRMSGPGRKPTGPAASEARDRFGIPGKVGSPSAPGPNTIDSSELERNLSAAGNATGASAAIQGVRRGAAFGKGVSEFAAGRKATPAVAKAAEKAAPAVSTKRAAPKADTLNKFNAGLKNAKSAADREKARQDILKADTLDEFGGAMKRGGSVKGYAKGGSISSASSRADGIAQRGKTRGTMFCGGGMAKGRK